MQASGKGDVDGLIRWLFWKLRHPVTTGQDRVRSQTSHICPRMVSRMGPPIEHTGHHITMIRVLNGPGRLSRHGVCLITVSGCGDDDARGPRVQLSKPMTQTRGKVEMLRR